MNLQIQLGTYTSCRRSVQVSIAALTNPEFVSLDNENIRDSQIEIGKLLGALDKTLGTEILAIQDLIDEDEKIKLANKEPETSLQRVCGFLTKGAQNARKAVPWAKN